MQIKALEKKRRRLWATDFTLWSISFRNVQWKWWIEIKYTNRNRMSQDKPVEIIEMENINWPLPRLKITQSKSSYKWKTQDKERIKTWTQVSPCLLFQLSIFIIHLSWNNKSIDQSVDQLHHIGSAWKLCANKRSWIKTTDRLFVLFQLKSQKCDESNLNHAEMCFFSLPGTTALWVSLGFFTVVCTKKSSCVWTFKVIGTFLAAFSNENSNYLLPFLSK